MAQSTSACSIPGPFVKATKEELVEQLLAAKQASGKTFNQIALALGVSNVYAANLFYLQQQLKPDTAELLVKAVPGLTSELVLQMKKAPARRFDPLLIQDPFIYRMYEAIMHSGEAMRAIINEEHGDGIMSAIDFHADLSKAVGSNGEQRVVMTMNGKYLPFLEQKTDINTVFRG
ncbi:MAG: hypothetical protein WDW38_000558 [Sanguina aurantia]